jgi:AP-2 complex subunit alpha
MVQLLDERDLGVLTAVMSLLVALVANNSEAYWNCVPKCVRTLERLTRGHDIPQEYTYYGIPSPWLQVYFQILASTSLFSKCVVVSMSS